MVGCTALRARRPAGFPRSSVIYIVGHDQCRMSLDRVAAAGGGGFTTHWFERFRTAARASPE
jgi:hypothetical protein